MDKNDQENPKYTDPHDCKVPTQTSLSEPGPGVTTAHCEIRRETARITGESRFYGLPHPYPIHNDGGKIFKDTNVLVDFIFFGSVVHQKIIQ